TNVVGKKAVATNVHLIEIHSSNQFMTTISNVSNFQNRLEPDFALYAKVVLLNSWQLQVRVNEKSHICTRRQSIDTGEGQRWCDKCRGWNWRRVVDYRCQSRLDRRDREPLILQRVVR